MTQNDAHLLAEVDVSLCSVCDTVSVEEVFVLEEASVTAMRVLSPGARATEYSRLPKATPSWNLHLSTES